MLYMTCLEASNKLNITPRRIQQMCKDGEISGVIKEGRSWMIPYNAISDIRNTDLSRAKKKSVPIGISDYIEASTEYYYVDKTLMIRDFLDAKPKVSLFTRPRRFGKTLNMDMLRVFFEKTDKDTSVYFRDKLIWECGSEYTKYQGKYPVIYLSFKDIKCSSWKETIEKISKLISWEFLRHIELEKSDKLNEYEKEQYVKIAKGCASEVEYEMGLQLLSRLLYKHYEKETVIIIDEYDTPIQQGYSCDFYSEIIGFMRNFFSGGLKDNRYLAYGFLTGILRVAKESIFSGLNNLKIYSVLDEDYSQYFGFTKAEVRAILSYYEVCDKYEEVCQWYDGYIFGETEIFNPWSVINYISEKCYPKAFWQATGSNDIIGDIITVATPEIMENLHTLLSGRSITSYVDTSVIYPEIQNNPYSIYSFLLVAGYLKVVGMYPRHDGNYICELAIPNREITFVYAKEVLNKTKQNTLALSIQQAIFTGSAEKIQENLEKFMLHSVASLDTGSEAFYHGMMLGLCALLSNQYYIHSNREAGLGRFDIQLMPQKKMLPGFLLEFKYTKDEKEDLNDLAREALRQIEDKKYDVELQECNVKQIIKIGIAFRGKNAVVKCNKV